jgi:predicted RNase H-like HicB family nuclease
MRRVQLTAVIERDGDGFVAFCPELDVASQGATREEARLNLTEAVEGFLDVASPQEVAGRLSGERYVETLEVTLG